MKKILIVEDDRGLNDGLVYDLQEEGYEVCSALTASLALELFRMQEMDLVLMDINLPDSDGFTLCSRMKKIKDVPVIFLTARDLEQDEMRGFDCGADDYVTKPFSPRVLLAKVNALLRRSSPVPGDTLQAGNLILLPASHKVYADGREVTLTHKEYELLHFLMTNPEQIFSREQLLNRVWGYDFEGTSRTVDTHIKTLRQKLGGECRHIVTLIRSGYKFEVAP